MGLESIVDKKENFGKRALNTVVDLGKRLIKRAPRDCLNSTSLLIVATPVQAINDTFIMEGVGRVMDRYHCNPIDLMAMTDQASIQGKVGVAALTYLFAGPLYQICRQASERKLGITQRSSEWIQGAHDFVFTALYSSSVLLGGYTWGYYKTGEWNSWAVGIALGISSVSQVLRGPLIGYSVDCGLDIFGYRECVRKTYPEKVKNMSKRGKIATYATAVAASLALTAGIYGLTPASWNNPHRLEERKQQQQIQQLERTQTTLQLDKTTSNPILEEMPYA
ncbi:hypothetical protein J4218_01810 [Candidatus Pacearchaeota archaeon]|nr:hypothetical protein [uncultured archaeon]MBS3078833.1 hypothetical protein [Candidatus Pacearchaeota archaeon]